MSKLPAPPNNLNPLWIIFLFFSFTELVLGVVVFKTSDAIQVALTIFVIGFPLLVAIGFFALLWSRPQHLYAPKDYGSDESFLKGMEGSRTSREGLLNMESIIQDKVNTLLTSDEIVKRLSTLKGEQLKDELKVTAANISNEIKETNFFTVSLQEISPSLKDLVLPVSGFADFNELTDEVYFAMDGAVEPFTYGTSWVLREKDTGKILRHARMITNVGAGKYVSDNRTLDEIGIKPGMTLDVIPVSKNAA
jgi:hypothetical protein